MLFFSKTHMEKLAKVFLGSYIKMDQKPEQGRESEERYKVII